MLHLRTLLPEPTIMADNAQDLTNVRSEYDPRYARRAMLLLAGLILIVLYVEGMLTPSLPYIASEFGVTSSQVSLVLAFYAVSGTALNPVAGKLGDIYGKKKVLVSVLLIYTVAVTVTGFSPSFTFLLVSRIVQGIGLTIVPLAMSIVREEFPRHIIPRAQGILSAMFGVGFAVSLPLGALVSNAYGWRTTYHTAVPFVILITVLVAVKIRESPFRKPGVRVDYAGSLLLGVSLVMTVLGFAEGPAWGWRSPGTLALLCSGALMLAPFYVYERYYSLKGREPILNTKILAGRNPLISNMVVFVTGMSMFLAFQAFVYRYELMPPVGYGLDIFRSGLGLAPLALGMMIFAPVTGRIVVGLGVKRVATAGALISSIGFLLISTTNSLPLMLVFMFVAGSGLSILNASAINLLILTVDPRDMGLATALNTVFRTFGTSLGAPIAGSVLSTFTAAVLIGQGTYALLPTASAFHYIYYITAGLLAAIALLIPFSAEILGRRVTLSGSPEKLNEEAGAV